LPQATGRVSPHQTYSLRTAAREGFPTEFPPTSFRRQQRNRRRPITGRGQSAILDCEIGSRLLFDCLLFDVTKRPILGIDNSMNAGLKAIRFISVVVPVYNSEFNG
jgi:hypothetical protein